MARRRLLWRLYTTYLLVILLCTVALGGYVIWLVRGYYHTQIADDLSVRALLLRGSFVDPLRGGDPALVDRKCKQLGHESGIRITVIRPDGQVCGDSTADITRMRNHQDRPEIIAAMEGEYGRTTRYSATLKTQLMYLAIPLRYDQQIVGVLRVAVPLENIRVTLWNFSRWIALGGGTVALFAAMLALLVSRMITNPIREMVKGAQRFANGIFHPKLLVPEIDQIAGLAEALNLMASQLDEKIRTTSEQGRRLQAILASMNEGVLAVDSDEQIISLNEAAAQLLDIDSSSVQHRTLQEVVRNVEMQEFVASVSDNPQVAESQIVIHHNEGERFLHLRGSRLKDHQGRHIGTLLVFHDISRMRQLENVRRDFVANVSHELKTPVTSIKGFVETLRDGAIKDDENANHFLKIIANQADRLNTIIDDLLRLSRIEKDSESGEVELAQGHIRAVLLAATDDCKAQSDAAGIRILLTCPKELTARINSQLMERAVVNLLENALNYSETGSEIELKARQTQASVVITVRDYGCGIAPEHRERIFERFYRVDKARSRKLGGNGLGLAIVKHIMQAHRGSVTVESTLGKGSVFSIQLPTIN